VALHEIFSRSGDDNMARFGRKRILCAINLNKPESGQQAFSRMSSAAQLEPLTSYLMFRLALLMWDRDLARKSLENLLSVQGRVQCRDLLYACIKEAQHSGDKICTLEAMKAIVQIVGANDCTLSNYPSLLRCTIRLMIMVEESDADGERNLGAGESFTEDLCAAFERGRSRRVTIAIVQTKRL
jgi:hypothetical protein